MTAHYRNLVVDDRIEIQKLYEQGTSFEDLVQTELNEFITEINNRPRKILGWATPAEVFQEECSQQATTTCCTPD